MPLFFRRARVGPTDCFASLTFACIQGQLGAEGAIMGFLYFAVGSSLSLITYAAPAISHSGLQRLTIYVSMGMMMMAMVTIVNIYRWKTGYRMFVVGF